MSNIEEELKAKCEEMFQYYYGDSPDRDELRKSWFPGYEKAFLEVGKDRYERTYKEAGTINDEVLHPLDYDRDTEIIEDLKYIGYGDFSYADAEKINEEAANRELDVFDIGCDEVRELAKRAEAKGLIEIPDTPAKLEDLKYDKAYAGMLTELVNNASAHRKSFDRDELAACGLDTDEKIRKFAEGYMYDEMTEPAKWNGEQLTLNVGTDFVPGLEDQYDWHDQSRKISNKEDRGEAYASLLDNMSYKYVEKNGHGVMTPVKDGKKLASIPVADKDHAKDEFRRYVAANLDTLSAPEKKKDWRDREMNEK